MLNKDLKTPSDYYLTIRNERKTKKRRESENSNKGSGKLLSTHSETSLQ